MKNDGSGGGARGAEHTEWENDDVTIPDHARVMFVMNLHAM